MKTPIILFRKDNELDSAEIIDAVDFFPVYTRRNSIPLNSLVIGRHSVLPYYKELENDLELNKSSLINSYEQHQYITSFDYAKDISNYTPRTWFQGEDLPESTSFIVKGKINSRRNQWLTHMYAETKRDAINIGCELLYDPMIKQQGIVYREYIKLDVLDYSVTNMPIAKEWRFFFYKNKLLTSGFYWTCLSFDLIKKFVYDSSAESLANTVANILGNKLNFYVVDIARTFDGNYIVIEINDAQMSGLSFCNAQELYSNLYREIRKEEN